MKRLVLCLALACTAPAFTACQTTTPVVQQQSATKAAIYVESAFNAAVTAERAAKANGILTGDKAAQADRLVVEAYAALKVIRAGYAANQSPDTSNMLSLVAQITVLINEVKS